MAVILQVALDFVDLHRAVKVAEEAIEGGADWLEIGTPLIKSEGMNAIRHLRKVFPGVTLLADMKTMDAGRAEMEASPDDAPGRNRAGDEWGRWIFAWRFRGRPTRRKSGLSERPRIRENGS
jgi:hypothetical protein